MQAGWMQGDWTGEECSVAREGRGEKGRRKRRKTRLKEGRIEAERTSLLQGQRKVGSISRMLQEYQVSLYRTHTGNCTVK